MKVRNKEKRLCCGKLVVTNFKKLNPESFKFLEISQKKQIKKELAICAPNGDIYINTAFKEYECIANIFEAVMQENKETLIVYIEHIKNQFPELRDINTFEEWGTYAAEQTNAKKIVYSLAILIIPLELERRKIENKYYSCNF